MKEDDIAIRVTNLSKKYQIGNFMNFSTSFEDWMLGKFNRIKKNLINNKKNSENLEKNEFFWALKDVSFNVNNGDVVGLIGGNGAGKSTLLKILSRITSPTSGKIEINGSIDSLLEVGTGFHQEMTGRENIYMNAALHGLNKKDIDSRFNDIVHFANIEKFLDTPVKHYSSGMYVRLGFAVAAHMDPDILLVDEVLSVGDVSFKKKCIRKIGEIVEDRNQTVLLVSHELNIIEQLCSRSLFLKAGSLEYYGDTKDVLTHYLDDENNSPLETTSSGYVFFNNQHMTDPNNIIQSIGLKKARDNTQYTDSFFTGEKLVIEITFQSIKSIRYFAIGINNFYNQRIFTVSTAHDKNLSFKEIDKGIVYCEIEKLNLVEGSYTLTIMVGDSLFSNLDGYLENCLKFQVNFRNYFETGYSLMPGQGQYVIDSRWTMSSF